MRLARFWLGACLAIALLPASAGATHSNGEGPNEDLVSGTTEGPIFTPSGLADAHAHSNVRGNAVAADGHVWVEIQTAAPGGDAKFTADALCVNAMGNQAIVRSVITKSDGPFPPVGWHLLGHSVDNGEGEDDPPDQRVGIITPPVPPSPCPPPPLFLPALPVDQGNLIVHDGG